MGKSVSFMKKLLALLAICLPVVTSCGGAQIDSDENYRIELQKYVGASGENIVADLGYADYLSESPSGNRLFVYTKSFTSTSSVNCWTDGISSQVCTGGSAFEFWCKTYFEVDDENLVVDFSFKGNSCKK
jgi:hypothetical protein